MADASRGGILFGEYRPISIQRDQQKWNPVLRPIARSILSAHDLIAKPRDTLADHARERRTLP